MQYQIVWGSRGEIEEKINKAISEGWVPQGGLVSCEYDGQLGQAMVKD